MVVEICSRYRLHTGSPDSLRLSLALWLLCTAEAWRLRSLGLLGCGDVQAAADDVGVGAWSERGAIQPRSSNTYGAFRLGDHQSDRRSVSRNLGDSFVLQRKAQTARHAFQFRQQWIVRVFQHFDLFVAFWPLHPCPRSAKPSNSTVSYTYSPLSWTQQKEQTNEFVTL